jgi:WXXGXW repeat (2 copies)
LVQVTHRPAHQAKSSQQRWAGGEGWKMRLVKPVRVLMICVVTLGAATLSPVAPAQVSVEFSVDFAPPELPVYEQPPCPGEGYIWTPGYWAWDDYEDDYYWVPGTWVEAPEPGYLWTPGYWAYEGDRYRFHDGYWGPEVGFYGGINYGYGYAGRGYEGGRWEGRRFYYNRAVNNVNEREVRNVYETRIQNNWNVPRVSYNGRGGVNERPTARDDAAARERHMARVAAQTQQVQQARANRELRATENHGRPPIAATQRPGTFSGGAVVAAREGGRYNPPANRGGNNPNRGGNGNNADRPVNENRPPNEVNRPANEANRPGANNRPENNRVENNQPNNRPTYVHPNDVPRHTQPENPNANANRKYQQQQQQLNQRQEQEHQKLQQRQDQEHQRMAQQNANAARQQQMEQRHQQQTQQMEQKHEQQQQRVQQRQQPKPQQQRQGPPPKEQKKPNEKQ